MKKQTPPSKVPAHSIAIIGMSCRLPGANTLHKFWHNLSNGVESLTQFSDEELLASGVDPSWVENPKYVKANAILDDITSFDADFFNVPPREAEVLDPQQRLFLECAWEALESAGINPHKFSGNIGVYAGSRLSEYLMFNQNRIDLVGLTTESPIVTTQRHWANDKDFLATRVSFKLNLRGPSITVQTACSTSLVTIHLACQSLFSGECDVALAGGVTVRVPQKAGYLYSEGMIFSPDGHTRSFDTHANGTIFSSGAGVVTLKRLEDAIADGDTIRAVIRGTAVNNDGGGAEKTRYSAPTVSGQARAILDAQKNANIMPDSISYIEAHGTATPVGDPIEVAGLTEAFRQNTDKKGYCAIGSVKSNIGHTVQASGVIGIIKAALMLQHKELVPTLHFTAPNPRIDFEASPFYVNTEHCAWLEGKTPRRAGVSSFGVGGTNAHIILEEAPELIPQTAVSPEPEHLLTLTAKNENALRKLAEAYHHFLSHNPDSSLANVCYTANSGRVRFSHRLAIMAVSAKEMVQKLAQFIAGEEDADIYVGNSDANETPIAFLFTGQGSQYGGMGHDLYKTEPIFKEVIDRCQELLKPMLDVPLLDILYPADEIENRLIHQTAYTQPALFALELGIATLWQSWGIQPTCVMGHSVGEYVAACVAGILTLEDGLKLIAERGRLMQSLPQDGEMAVIFTTAEQVIKQIESSGNQISIAAINGPTNIVVSGVTEAVQAVLAQFTADDIRTRALTTSHAFHSQLMTPILDEFEQVAASITQSAPQLTIISNVTGKPMEMDSPPSAAYWCQHVRKGVQFLSAIEYLATVECKAFVEIGPNPTLLGMARRCLPDLMGEWLPSIRKGQNGWRQMRQSLIQLFLRGVPINWTAVTSNAQNLHHIELPTYPFQRKRYWVERTVTDTETAVSSNLLSSNTHPLLGQRLHSPLAEAQFFADISPNEVPFLYEHRAFDVITLPATGYVEMIHAAASEFFGSEWPFIGINNLIIHQPLLFPKSDTHTVQLILSPHDKQTADFKIFSLNKGDDNKWTLHVSGAVAAETHAEIETAISIEEIQTRCTESLSIELFYQEKRAKGIYHGPDFQGVREVWRTDGEALGNIHLPRNGRLIANEFKMHPALLDACIQISMAAFAVEDDNNDLYLPMVWEQITFHADVPQALWSHVKSQPSNASKELRTVDINLYSKEEQLVVTIKGLHFKRAKRDALLQNIVANQAQDWLHQVSWIPQPLTEKETPPDQPFARWLIFADSGGVGTAVANQLQAQGDEARCIMQGRAITLNGTGLTIPQWNDPQDYDKLLTLYANQNQDTKLNIVYLWGIEQTDMTQADPTRITENLNKSVGSLLRLIQATMRAFPPGKTAPTFSIVTQGAQAAGWQPGPHAIVQAPLWGLGKVIMREYPMLNCALIDLDPADSAEKVEALCTELTATTIEKQVAFRSDTRLVSRLVSLHAQSAEKADLLSPPNAQPYRLISKEPGTFDGLQLASMERKTPARGEVEIQILATGLNFRDVLIALGRFDDVIGRECSGVVVACGADITHVAVGDAVMAIAPESFASFVTVKGNYVVRKPRHLSFAEAATVPMVFLTAYYGLHTLAKIKRGDRVLIHAASGGVGHAAMQLAKQCGAEIYATASKKKWPYLRSLGIKNIMDSRSLDFADEIMQLTDGVGVDIVLNSLAGEFITKSLEVLSENGRFIEIGATDVWSEEEVAAVKPSVSYHWFHLGKSVAQKRPEFFQEMFQQVAEGLATGLYKPLPRYIFKITEAIDAFRFMSQARHIGKVVVTHQPHSSDTNQELVQRIHEDGAYLVTGGLGGLGLKIAQWLADNGAKHLVLLGRSAPSETAVNLLNQLREAGINIAVAQADVADLVALQSAMAAVSQTMPSLRGVIHAAGVVDDGILQQLDWRRFEKVFAPKVAGSWNLHLLTERQPLDFFVLFSSVSSLWGGAGQGNYAAANAFLDALAHYRRARGLTAVSINWGAWSEVGMAANLGEAVERRRAKSGMGKISPDDGLRILARIFNIEQAQIGVVPANWSIYAQQFSVDTQKSFLSQLTDTNQATAKPSAKKQPKLLQRLEAASANDQEAILIDYAQAEIARIGGIEKSKLKIAYSLDEMGIDSLMAIELRNRIAADLQIDVPMNEFLSNPTITRLTNLLLTQYNPDSTDQAETSITAWSPVVPMETNGRNHPLFCVHGIGGHTMRFNRLVKHLGDNQPFYGLQAQGLQGSTDRLPSVEAMAAQYIEAITAVQATGPYMIAGYSFGSYVAYEMACQMVAKGHEISALILLDGKATLLKLYEETLDWRAKATYPVHHIQDKLAFHQRRMNPLSNNDQWTYLREMVAGGATIYERRKISKFDEKPYDNSQASLRLNQMIKHNLRLAQLYKPRPYSGKITFYAATQDRGYHGWNHLAQGGIDIIPIPGTHISIMDEPNVPILAKDLGERLDRINKKIYL